MKTEEHASQAFGLWFARASFAGGKIIKGKMIKVVAERLQLQHG